MSEINTRITLANDPCILASILERFVLSMSHTVEPVEGGYKHTFAPIPISQITPIGFTTTLIPAPEFIRDIKGQITADAIVRHIRETVSRARSNLHSIRAARRAKLRRRRKMRARRRQRKLGLV